MARMAGLEAGLEAMEIGIDAMERGSQNRHLARRRQASRQASIEAMEIAAKRDVLG